MTEIKVGAQLGESQAPDDYSTMTDAQLDAAHARIVRQVKTRTRLLSLITAERKRRRQP